MKVQCPVCGGALVWDHEYSGGRTYTINPDSDDDNPGPIEDEVECEESENPHGGPIYCSKDSSHEISDELEEMVLNWVTEYDRQIRTRDWLSKIKYLKKHIQKARDLLIKDPEVQKPLSEAKLTKCKEILDKSLEKIEEENWE